MRTGRIDKALGERTPGRARALTLLLLLGWTCLSCSSAARRPGRSPEGPDENEQPPEPVQLRLNLTPGACLAYRLVRSTRPILRTEDEGSAPMISEGALFVDVDREGVARVLEQPEGRGASPISGDHAQFLSSIFPVPDVPIGSEPISRRRLQKGRGQTSNSSYPDIAIEETFHVTGREGQRLFLAVQRLVRVEGEALLGGLIEHREEIDGVFDLEAGLFERVVHRSYAGLEAPEEDEEPMTTLHLELATELAEERRARRDRLEASRRGAAETLDEYIAEHDPASEIDEAITLLVEDSQDRRGIFIAQFYFSADQAGLFRRLLQVDDPQTRAELLSLMVPQPGLRLDDDSIELLLSRIADPPVAYFLARLADPRLRAELERLSTGADPRLAEVATETLETLILRSHPEAPELLRLFERDGEAFMRLGLRLIIDSDDPRPVAGALVEILQRPGGPDGLCLQWLEAITYQTFLEDTPRWQTYWEEHRERPYVDWVVEAARADSPLRANAVRALWLFRGDASLRAPLLEALEAEDEAVRLAAAETLALMGNHEGLPVLIDAMSQGSLPETTRAVLRLSRLSATTLGYRPTGTEEERGAAVARWEAWARR